MKVRTVVDLPGQEIEVTISGQDITAALLEDCEEGRSKHVIRAVNRFGGFMLNVPEVLIIEIDPKARQIFADFFETQARRMRGTSAAIVVAPSALTPEASAAEQLKLQVGRMVGALTLARPVLDEQLQSLCFSFCPPCARGDDFDYSELKSPEKEWIENTEAALDAVEAALRDPRPEVPEVPR